jgi:tRNA (guanine26-N2/guanine27-N2)-dimethyltransferase
MKLVKHTEGQTELIVPSVSLTVDPPPTSPVFFNPAASLNRDISVAVVAATDGLTFCDSMAGVGARGLRVANEVSRVGLVTLVDFNRRALEVARRAAVLNSIRRKCEFSESETSSFLFSRYGRGRRFDYVDVDPFGTPVGQLQGALCATTDGGVLSVTATDTAVLCGVYPKVAKRRYGALPVNNHFNHETAIRLLAGGVARIGASVDIGVEPVAAHSTRHYVRLFLRIHGGASSADSALARLGYVAWCPACGHTEHAPEQQKTCVKCGGSMKVAGPIWVGGVTQQPLVQDAAKAATRLGLMSAAEVLRGLTGVDSFPPWSFSIEKICSSLRVATVPESEVCRNLKGLGHRYMRTPFEKTGIKTDAEFSEVVSAVKRAVGTPGRGRGITGPSSPRRNSTAQSSRSCLPRA